MLLELIISSYFNLSIREEMMKMVLKDQMFLCRVMEENQQTAGLWTRFMQNCDVRRSAPSWLQSLRSCFMIKKELLNDKLAIFFIFFSKNKEMRCS